MFSFLKAKSEIEYPSAEWLNRVNKSAEYTPDMHKLDRYHVQWVFMFDECMRRHPQFSIVNEGSFFGASAFTNELFTVYKKKLGKESFPIALENFKATDTQPRSIKGELFGMQPQQLFKLDNYKQNGVLFTRRKVKVTVPYFKLMPINDHILGETTVLTNEAYKTIRAWMYIGTPKWADVIDAGYFFSPVRHFQHRNKHSWVADYYYFTLDEYKE